MLEMKRLLSEKDRHPNDSIAWENEDIEILTDTGEVIYSCYGGAFPANWSRLARQTVASKYFRESRVTSEKEKSGSTKYRNAD